MLSVIQRQTECVLGAQEELLRNLNSIDGLRRWRDALVELSRQTDCAGGCPLGSLASELGELPRPRALLAESFKRWQSYFVAGFASMRARGELRADADPAELATAV